MTPHKRLQPGESSAPSETPAAPEPVTLDAAEHQRLLAQAAQAQEHLDKYRRTLAEFDNAKKRLERERQEAVRFGAERVVRDLLPIVDSFDHALKTLSAADEKDPVVIGVKLIHRQLHDVLHREGVRSIESVGRPFDPHQHEASAEVPAADGQPDHTIVEEIQKGYVMHGKVLRSALVKVAVHPSQPAAAGSHRTTEAASGDAPQPRTNDATPT